MTVLNVYTVLKMSTSILSKVYFHGPTNTVRVYRYLLSTRKHSRFYTVNYKQPPCTCTVPLIRLSSFSLCLGICCRQKKTRSPRTRWLMTIVVYTYEFVNNVFVCVCVKSSPVHVHMYVSLPLCPGCALSDACARTGSVRFARAVGRRR